MSTTESISAEIDVENIGGIESASVQFEPGITVLAGRNATNRTSLLRAIMAGLGSDRVSLKADAEEGSVELTVGETTCRRHFERRNGTVVPSGDPYLTDARDVEVADLFAFLLESNEARRAVAGDQDLHDVLMRPIDTVAIEEEINELVARRDALDAELSELEERAAALPGLESRKQELVADREELDADLAAKREALEQADESVQARREQQSELDDRMADLESARGEVTRIRQRLKTERRSIDSLEEELAELEGRREELPAPPEADVDVEAELEHCRERQSRLETQLTELQSVVQFNEKMLEDGDSLIREVLGDGEDSPADELLPDDERGAVCWSCGSAVERATLQGTLETLREVRQEKLEERSSVRERIDELQDLQQAQREHAQERRQLDRRIEDTREEIAERSERVEELRDEREQQEARVEELEAAVRDLQTEEQDELLDLHREINELEFEREQVDSELEEVTDEIDRIEARLADREDLEAERESITERLEELRTRIERTEAEAVEQFNEHMAEVLEMLGYENIDRVWIERRTQGTESRFDLHVVRSTADGTAYEDRLQHLSESEREVVGLVFALAGYLVHDVHETVPFLLLDSLEALDSVRIASLVDYFGEYAENLVVALLPEDAGAVDDDAHRISEF